MAVLPPRLLTGTVVSAAGRVIGTVLSIGTVALITRALIVVAGPEAGVAAYGTYATVLAYSMMFSILADGGLYLVFTREASRRNAEEVALLENAWRLRFLTSAGAYVIAVGVALLLPYSRVVRFGILLAMSGVVCQLGSQLLLGVFQKRLQLLPPALAEISGRVVQFAATALAAATHAGIFAFLVAFVAGTLTTLLWNICGAARLIPFRLHGRWEPLRARFLVREAWPLGLSLVLSMIFFKVDSVLLSLLRPAADVALYALPYKILESLLFFPAMVGGMLLPVFSRALRDGPHGLAQPLRAAVDFFLVSAIPIVALLYFGSPRIIQLLGGPAYLPSVAVLRVLSFALGVLFLGNLFGNAVFALGGQRSLLAVYVFLTIFNVGVNLFVIPRYSYMGAAWTTLATEFLSVVLVGTLLLRRRIPLFRTASTWRIMGSGGLFISLLLVPLPLALRIPVAFVGYGAALVACGVVLPRDLLALLRAQQNHAH